MQAENELRIVKAEAFTLTKDDVLVVGVKGQLTEETREKVVKELKNVFGNQLKVLIVNSDLVDIRAFRKDEIENV